MEPTEAWSSLSIKQASAKMNELIPVMKAALELFKQIYASSGFEIDGRNQSRPA